MRTFLATGFGIEDSSHDAAYIDAIRALLKYARPIDGEGAEGPLAVLGNMVKAGIIRYLRRAPGSGRKAITDALQIPATTIVPHLGELEAAGLLLADPPRGQRKRGEWVVCRVNDEAVTELYLRLGQGIGEV